MQNPPVAQYRFSPLKLSISSTLPVHAQCSVVIGIKMLIKGLDTSFRLTIQAFADCAWRYPIS